MVPKAVEVHGGDVGARDENLEVFDMRDLLFSYPVVSFYFCNKMKPYIKYSFCKNNMRTAR